MIYIVLLKSALLPLLALPSRSKLAIWLGASVVLAFSAVRFNAGIDYIPYYRAVAAGDISRFEPASRLLMHIGERTDPQVYFALSSAVIIGFFTATIFHLGRRQPISRLAILAFVCLPVALLDSMSFVRQFCGASVLAYAMARRDAPVLSMVLCALAVAFHTVTAVFVPVVVLSMFWVPRFPRWLYVVGLAFALLAGPTAEWVAVHTQFYAHYFANYSSSYGQRAFLLMLAITGLLIFRLPRIEYLRAEFHLFYAGIIVLAALIPYGSLVARAGWSGVFIYTALIGAVLAKESFLVRLVSVVAMVGVFAILIYLAWANPSWNWLTDYRVSPLLSADEKQKILDDYAARVR